MKSKKRKATLVTGQANFTKQDGIIVAVEEANLVETKLLDFLHHSCRTLLLKLKALS